MLNVEPDAFDTHRGSVINECAFLAGINCLCLGFPHLREGYYILHFCMSPRRHKICSGHAFVCMCLCVCPLLQGVPSSSALLGGFAISARVSLL